jgi:ComF family protein
VRWQDTLRQVAVAFFCPQACVVCDGWVANPDLSPLCASCHGELEAMQQPFCHVCGIPLPGNLLESAALCSYCREGIHGFNHARAWGPYAGNLRRVIQAFKYDGCRRLAAPLGTLLLQCYQTHFSRIDWIIPVPSHPKRRAQRGYDQTLILGKSLAKDTGVLLFRHLSRKRNTAPQYGLDLDQRRRNVRGAFALRQAARLAGKKVLVVDDVMTTGATVQEICSLLQGNSKVKSIDVLTIARVARLN